MRINEEDLKRLYRAYVALNMPDNRTSCPSLDKLNCIFDPHVRGRKKHKLIDHVTSCALCAKEFEFLREIQGYQIDLIRQASQVQKTGLPIASLIKTSRREVSSWWLINVVAGLFLIVLSVAVILQIWSGRETMRTNRMTVTLLTPVPSHPASWPLVFEWKEVKDAKYYILELFDEALLPVWKGPEISTTRLSLPKEIFQQLLPNRPYYWMVTAYGNNDKLADSPLLRFLIVGQQVTSPRRLS